MKPYKQSTIYTAASTSLMIIINHFKSSFKLTQKNEFLIWQNTATLPTRGSSLFALANFAKEQGLKPIVIVGDPNYKFPRYRFKGYKKVEIDIANKNSGYHKTQSKDLNIPIKISNFNLEDVKQLLYKGKTLLLRINIGILRQSKYNKLNVHYIPVYNYGNNKFAVMDPSRGKLIINEALFKEAFEAVETKCKRDNRMIIF
jgi:hypothetical protein